MVPFTRLLQIPNCCNTGPSAINEDSKKTSRRLTLPSYLTNVPYKGVISKRKIVFHPLFFRGRFSFGGGVGSSNCWNKFQPTHSPNGDDIWWWCFVYHLDLHVQTIINSDLNTPIHPIISFQFQEKWKIQLSAQFPTEQFLNTPFFY